jgi:hypothetical protein
MTSADIQGLCKACNHELHEYCGDAECTCKNEVCTAARAAEVTTTEHIAFVLAHDLLGRCTCETCAGIRAAMDALIAKEVKDFLADNPQLGPPPACDPYNHCDICKQQEAQK